MRVMVVPGSARVRLEAEAEGLDKIITDVRRRVALRRLLDVPRHEPRPARPGGALRVDANRNFEGRQGKGGRTHLVSPLVAAATAVRGTLSSPSDLDRSHASRPGRTGRL